MTNIKDYSDDRLVEDYKDLWETIYKTECFGTRDLQLLYQLEDELYARGYRATSNIEIYKPDEILTEE